MSTNDKKDLIFALAMSSLSIFLTVDSFNYAYDSSVLLRGLAILLVILSLVYLLKIVTKSKENKGESANKPTKKAALLVFSLILASIILIPLVGFFASFFLFIYATQLLIAKKHKNLYIFYAFGLSLFIYIIFFGFLGVSLPESILPIDQFIKIF